MQLTAQRSVVDRYEMAMLFRKHWELLKWKGDDHTQGIYLNEKYVYLMERTYAVRIKHDTPAPSVFFVPGVTEEEDEVYTSYPFTEMKKRPNKTNVLFEGENLTREELDEIFAEPTQRIFEAPLRELSDFLQLIPKKRDRDRVWLAMKAGPEGIEGFLIHKKGRDMQILYKMDTPLTCEQEGGDAYIIANANTVLHALNLFSSPNTILFSARHDRIKITNEESLVKVEAIIATPKQTIQKEIKGLLR